MSEETHSTQCTAPVETYSRVVGFFRPVQHWNKGKQEEFADRQGYNQMGCIKIKDGFICGPDSIVDLSRYGAHVWMEWHSLGPIFFRSESRIKPIVVPSKKTWDAYDRWRKR
jgi:hypothetical protein